MPRSLGLIRAILAGTPHAAEAPDILADAFSLGLDPIDYCVRRFGVSEIEARRRAADWIGLDFSDEVPPAFSGACRPRRLDALAHARTVLLEVEGTPVTFAAPDFIGLVRLDQALAARPALARRLCLVPPAALRAHLVRCAAPQLADAARQTLALKWPFASAHLELTLRTRILFAATLFLAVLVTALAPFTGPAELIALTMAVVVAPALLRLAALRAMRGRRRPLYIERPRDGDLPVYTVLLPLRDEAHMVPQLYRAMCALDYPPERLDIKFVVEADCPRTLAAVARCLDDPRFELVAVPPGNPRTKPKAMNYALPLVRGEHVVVYDAEDRPAPDQLWHAVQRFRADPRLSCLQAELVVDNGGENALTALFAGEYAGLFGIVLPALARWGVPVPLGGTSNHFRTDVLRAVGGWDGFNVTEDADLGVRLARLV